jgi:RNA polymerase sigma-70 factor (ECF subfamily)
MAASDLALARRLLAGEEPAFDEFFAEYFPRLYRFACARLGGNEDEAEDVVQATLIKALDKMRTYRGEAALFTWLCTFCRREIADRFERTGKMSEVSLTEALAILSSDDIERALERDEISRLVHAALDLLPGRYAHALEWRYMEGASVPEISQRLGLGYKAAESLLSRARDAFRAGFVHLESRPLEES